MLKMYNIYVYVYLVPDVPSIALLVNATRVSR